MEVYVPGAVAGILGGSQNIKKSSREKKLKSKQCALEALFNKPVPTPTSEVASTNHASTEKKRKIVKSTEEKPLKSKQRALKALFKKSQSTLLKESDSPFNESTSPAVKIKSAKKRKKADSVGEKSTTPTKKAKNAVIEKSIEGTTPESKKVGRAQQRENRKKKNPEKDLRTIFVGNLPNKIVKRKLEMFFKKYGVIESVRFRSAAPSDLKLPKKAIMNTKSFHKELSTMNGYVVFKKKEAAKDALAGNGELLEGNHIRVDLAKNAKKVDTKKSVFVGNLPFDVADEQLRAHFQDCGTIEGIRVIRESRTGLGKGFGYVKFEEKDGVDMAIRLNGHLFLKRTLRVQKAEDMTNTKDKKNKTTSKPDGEQVDKNKVATGRKKLGRCMPSNVTSNDFQGVKAKSLKKIKKQKKQRKKFKKHKQAGAEALKDGRGVVSKKIHGMHPHKGTAARARIAKRIKKSNPRKT